MPAIEFATELYPAPALFEMRQDLPWPGNIESADCLIRHIRMRREHLIGPGIYACFFDGQLVYLGKFRGTKRNPFDGQVQRARWDKHLGTLTMRGKNVSLQPEVRTRVIKSLGDMPDVSDAGLVDEIRQANEDSLTRDRGMVASYSRVRFAAKHRNIFSQDPAGVPARFAFLYVRVLWSRDLDAMGISPVRAAISAAEKRLIEEFDPICNSGSAKTFPLNEPGPTTVRKIIESALTEAFRDTEIEQSMDRVTTATNAAEVKEPGTNTTQDVAGNETVFLDGINDVASDFVDRLRACVEGIYEVYFTATGTTAKERAADLRIRFEVPGRRPRVLLTMIWLESKSRLRCSVLATVEECIQSGFAADQVKKAKDAVMNAQITLESKPGEVEALLRILDASARRLTREVKCI